MSSCSDIQNINALLSRDCNPEKQGELIYTTMEIINLNLENELWKEISGYEEYYMISNFGRIKSTSAPRLKIISFYKSIRKAKIIKAAIRKDGYAVAKLCINGKTKSYALHRLVAKAFIPNPDNKPEINHKDFNKLNNHYSNLEWCTQKENYLHALKHGKIKFNFAKRQKKITFRAIPIHKYSDEKIKIVRNLWETGLFTQYQLAGLLGSTEKYIFQILHNQKRKNIL